MLEKKCWNIRKIKKTGQGLPEELGKYIWLAKADTSQEAPASKSGSSSQNINAVMNHYFDNGKVEISPRGSLKIGKITMQRKGGDGGRETANMLQFKLDPAEIFSIK